MPPGLGGVAGMPPGVAPPLGPLQQWARHTFAALSIRNYRLFFYGHGLSLIGTWMRRTALGWLVYMMTGSKALLGTVMALSLLPLFLLSPLAGALADRFDKRRIIIVSQVLAAVVSAALALLVWGGSAQVWQIGALALIGGVAFALEVPARQAFVVEMVGRDHLLNAIALNSALINATRIIGPAIAGLIMGVVGVAACFALDALSYLVVIATLLALRLEHRPPPVERRSHLQLIAEGARVAFRHPTVRLVIFMLTSTGIFGWSFQSLLPAIAQDNLHLDELRYGVLMSMFGVGAIVGALVTASRAHAPRRLRQMFHGVWAMFIGLAFLSLTRSFLPTCAALLVAGFGGVLFVSTGNTMVQLSVADSMRGRVMGIWALAFGGSLPMGSWMAGHVAEAPARLDRLPLANAWPAFSASFLGANASYLAIALFALVLLGCILFAERLLAPSALRVEEERALRAHEAPA
ncbi:MAG: MFS transporter [Candidatus Sumerlaeia bacterium]|nr:MFS transporter [Candidatus Sumerlaeia bacterium]